VQLVRQFAHKAQAHGTHEDGVLDHELPVGGKGEGRVGKVGIHHLGQHLSGVGTGEVDHPHGVGQVDQVKIPVVETGVVADPLHGLAGPAGGGGEIVVVFTQLDDNAVVDDAAVVVAHGRVLDPAFFDLLISDTYTRCRALRASGPWMRNLPRVDPSSMPTLLRTLRISSLQSNILGKVAGALPDADVAEDAAVGFLGVMQRGAFEHVVVVAGIGGQKVGTSGGRTVVGRGVLIDAVYLATNRGRLCPGMPP
jgi:hypothetical protein